MIPVLLLRIKNTWVGLVAVGDGDVSIVTRISEYDCTDSAVVLSVLDLEAAEEASVFNESNLSLDINTQFNKAVEIVD
jgi:hypothetical protein